MCVRVCVWCVCVCVCVGGGGDVCVRVCVGVYGVCINILERKGIYIYRSLGTGLVTHYSEMVKVLKRF